MILSHERRFIFIHVYKVAGTSVTRALLPFASDAVQGILRRLKAARDAGSRPLKSSTSGTASPEQQPIPPSITAQQLRQRLGAERFDSYFSFAFVRNPWDWQVSLYEFIRSQPQNRDYAAVSQCADFSAYLRWRCAGHVELQSSFVLGSTGRQLVDFLGRYERLNQDFAHVCRSLQISAELPHLNRTVRRPYQDYYSSSTRELVAAHYREDIERFGYQFD